jgi:hypothetical protein
LVKTRAYEKLALSDSNLSDAEEALSLERACSESVDG